MSIRKRTQSGPESFASFRATRRFDGAFGRSAGDRLTRWRMFLGRPWLVPGLLLALTNASATAQPSELAIKATFIPKFVRYVTWPRASRPAPRQPIQLCIIGRDPFGALLDRAARKEAAAGRPMQVQRLPSEEGAAGCHLAFVQGEDGPATTRLLGALRAHPILTITDSRSGPQRGMIHFTLSDGRVRFFIDEAAAADRGLSISSRLLALALGVRQRRS